MGQREEVHRMRDLTEKQFVAAMVRNGFIKDDSLLNGFHFLICPYPGQRLPGNLES
jgi:hypothetical protein